MSLMFAIETVPLFFNLPSWFKNRDFSPGYHSFLTGSRISVEREMSISKTKKSKENHSPSLLAE